MSLQKIKTLLDKAIYEHYFKDSPKSDERLFLTSISKGKDGPFPSLTYVITTRFVPLIEDMEK